MVLGGFSKIDPKSIQPSIQQVFHDAGFQKNYSTENYVYGFAKEIRKRLALLEKPLTSSGEMLDLQNKGMPGKVTGALTEGVVLQVLVDKRERNAEAVRLCKELHGVKYICCEFDFEAFYGPLGSGFIHAHHLHPLSDTNGVHEIDPVKDLVLTCPNCHAMVHRAEKLLTIAELKCHIAGRACKAL